MQEEETATTRRSARKRSMLPAIAGIATIGGVLLTRMRGGRGKAR